MDFKSNLLLIIIRDSFEIGVENLHVFSVENFTIVHCDNRLIVSYLDKYAALIESHSYNIGILGRDCNAPSHTQVVFEAVQQSMIFRMMN